MTTAAPSSLHPEALPAVTVPPSGLNIGFNFAKSPIAALYRIVSSLSNTTVPFFVLSSIGIISLSNFPASVAA